MNFAYRNRRALMRFGVVLVIVGAAVFSGVVSKPVTQQAGDPGPPPPPPPVQAGQGIEPPPSSTPSPASTPTTGLQPQVNDEAGVYIEVEPVALATGKAAAFRVLMDTHSGSLNQDLMEEAVLYDPDGTRLKPSSWSGPAGGHHVVGVLLFPVIEKPGKYTLVIRNVRVDERAFVWGTGGS